MTAIKFDCFEQMRKPAFVMKVSGYRSGKQRRAFLGSCEANDECAYWGWKGLLAHLCPECVSFALTENQGSFFCLLQGLAQHILENTAWCSHCLAWPQAKLHSSCFQITTLHCSWFSNLHLHPLLYKAASFYLCPKRTPDECSCPHLTAAALYLSSRRACSQYFEWHIPWNWLLKGMFLAEVPTFFDPASAGS